jgi:hypothetical protein
MGNGGAFQVPQEPQAQQKPGLVARYMLCMNNARLRMHASLEKHMAPPSEATKLESSGSFIEYVGSGKLKDKKVLITGGEYVLAREDNA